MYIVFICHYRTLLSTYYTCFKYIHHIKRIHVAYNGICIRNITPCKLKPQQLWSIEFLAAILKYIQCSQQCIMHQAEVIIVLSIIKWLESLVERLNFILCLNLSLNKLCSHGGIHLISTFFEMFL